MPDGNTLFVTRRERLHLPKRRWHALAGVTLLCLTTISLYAMTKMHPQKTDPYINGKIKLAEIPKPLELTNLNTDSSNLPDLLAGDVVEGENPTSITTSTSPARQTDALGNPTGQNSSLTIAPDTQAPKTILIDGQSISGNTTLYDDLIKTGPFGPLPQKASNGRSAFTVYKKPAERKSNNQIVSIIISGLGVNAALTEEAIRVLPAEVTLSFAAQSAGLQGWINKAREDGHEVLLEIPMDSDSFNPADPGASLTLKADQPDVNNRHLDQLLSQAQGYFGVINYNGNKFLTRTDATAQLLERLSNDGLAFISDGAFLTPSLEAIALSVNLPYKQGIGVIDPEPNLNLIKSELSRLSAIASTGTKPVGVGFAYPETLQAVSEWTATLKEESLQLVPASATIVE